MTTQSTISTSSISAPVTESSWQKKAMLSVAFLMATTSVGPGFLTQTAVFTNIYKVDMAFPVLASIFITFGIVMNLWRIVGVSGMRIQDIANKVAPGMGYGVGFIILTSLGTVTMDMPILLLMLAGLVNSIILPIVLGTVLVATKRKDIVGDYQHPMYLTLTGAAIVIVMAASSLTNIGNFMAKFVG